MTTLEEARLPSLKDKIEAEVVKPKKAAKRKPRKRAAKKVKRVKKK